MSVSFDQLPVDDIKSVVGAVLVAPVGFAVWEMGETDVADLMLKFINLAGSEPTGKPPLELFHKSMREVMPEVIGTALETAIREVMKTQRQVDLLVRTTPQAGEIRAFRNTLTPLGETLVLATFIEVTHEVFLEREYRVERRTNLASRQYFDDVLGDALDDFAAGGPPVGLVFIDVDKFKHINDTYGHICGDETLAEIARRLRISSQTPELICRWGGDEFAIITRWDEPENEAFAKELLEQFKAPFVWAGNEIHIKISIGLASTSTAEEASARQLMLDADGAMFNAKSSGGGWIAIAHDGLL